MANSRTHQQTCLHCGKTFKASRSSHVYWLHRQPITSFVSYVSADSMSVRSVPICRDELMPYLQVEV